MREEDGHAATGGGGDNFFSLLEPKTLIYIFLGLPFTLLGGRFHSGGFQSSDFAFRISDVGLLRQNH